MSVSKQDASKACPSAGSRFLRGQDDDERARTGRGHWRSVCTFSFYKLMPRTLIVSQSNKNGLLAHCIESSGVDPHDGAHLQPLSCRRRSAIPETWRSPLSRKTMKPLVAGVECNLLSLFLFSFVFLFYTLEDRGIGSYPTRNDEKGEEAERQMYLLSDALATGRAARMDPQNHIQRSAFPAAWTNRGSKRRTWPHFVTLLCTY